MSPPANAELGLVPGFILKLWKMINDHRCDEIIAWSDNGQSFIIRDAHKFSQGLSKYFKHNNLSSFIRQLNMYGFRKVATIENCGVNLGSGMDDLHFYHPDFIRGQPKRLEGIKRKLPQKLAETVDLRNVYKGISEIEDKQKSVSQSLADLKRENEMLWSELHDLRLKHHQQQLYISGLMKLVFEAMEQNGINTNMLQLKHKSPLMIEGAVQQVGGDQETDKSGGPSVSEARTETPTTFSEDQEMTASTDKVDETTLMTPIHVESQVENFDNQLDNFVPTIGEFTEEDMNIFAEQIFNQ